MSSDFDETELWAYLEAILKKLDKLIDILERIEKKCS